MNKEDARVEKRTDAGLPVTTASDVEPESIAGAGDDFVWFAAQFRAIYDGFFVEALNGVICSIPDTGLNTAPHRTWCAQCQRRWMKFKALVEMLESATAPEPAECHCRYCPSCIVRWANDPNGGGAL